MDTKEKPKRKGISKKTRMEIFKRDSFKCVYCGRTVEADGVKLVIDHIKPVAEGGENDYFNLVTACFDCNAGKGKKELSDKSVIEKQRKELELQNSRRNQLLEMKQWRDEVVKIRDSEIDYFNEELSRLFGRTLNDLGRNKVGKLIKRYTLKKCIEMLESISGSPLPKDRSYIDYLERCIKVADVCTNDPYLKDTFYIRKIVLNRFNVNNREKYQLKNGIHNNLCAGIDKYNLINEAQNCKSVWAFLDWLEGGE